LDIKYIQGQLGQAIQQGVAWLEARFKQWTQPTKANQVAGALTDLTRSKSELIAENMFLRQQLIVLERQVVRPKLKQRDRQILVMLASRVQLWRDALIIVKPETLVRWHRRGFKLFWRWKSRTKQGRSPIAAETIALIEEIAINNRTWRVKRIQGELLKLNIKVSKETVKRYVQRAQELTAPPTRADVGAFLANHAGETWACDLTSTPRGWRIRCVFQPLKTAPRHWPAHPRPTRRYWL
jgi:putative transposase